jgi:ABC-type nitrate/sulfonate/bicarbonate transport system substrate-binding protein
VKRRQFLAASGAAALSAAMPAAFAQQVTLRQGYQTNMWGMPTYYLMRSGALEKHGIKVEEFAVPSGNITMQQMVGRQVDLGTYAGPSFIIGHDKGGLVAIAVIETVGKTAAIAEADGIGTILMDLSSVDNIPVFMAATPDFVQKHPQAVVAYLRAWLDVSRDFRQNPKKVADVIYGFFASKGYKMSPETFGKALSRVQVDPGFPKDLAPYLQHHAEVLLKEKKISAIPDWKKALRPDFMDKARA